MSNHGTIIEIGNILVSEDVILEFFACDYPVCKGCCCIIGDSGAPLKEQELEPPQLLPPHAASGTGRRGNQGVL